VYLPLELSTPVFLVYDREEVWPTLLAFLVCAPINARRVSVARPNAFLEVFGVKPAFLTGYEPVAIQTPNHILHDTGNRHRLTLLAHLNLPFRRRVAAREPDCSFD